MGTVMYLEPSLVSQWRARTIGVKDTAWERQKMSHWVLFDLEMMWGVWVVLRMS